jgi:hypothetical protein
MCDEGVAEYSVTNRLLCDLYDAGSAQSVLSTHLYIVWRDIFGNFR